MKTTTLTLRIPFALMEHLDRLAETTQRTRSSLGCEAIRRYLELECRQPAEIRHIGAATGREDFAASDKLVAIVKKRAG